MKKFLLVLSFALLLAACGGGNDTESANNQRPVAEQPSEEAGIVTIMGFNLPVYPGAVVFQNLGAAISYTVDEDPYIVMGWYDQSMMDIGWRWTQDWSEFGEQSQKDFLRGEALGNSALAQQMVKIAVGEGKDSGTLFMLAPIPNRYGQ